MESIIYRGIEIRTEKSRTGEVWLQTRTKESAQAYAEATGEVVMSYLHTIGWVEATVEEIKEQIDEMLGEAPAGEVVPAPANEGSVEELAEINDDFGAGMSEAMEYATELDRGSRIETTDRPLSRSLRDIMVEKNSRESKHFVGTWSKDPVAGDWLAHIENSGVLPGDTVTLKTRAGRESTHTVDRIVANGRNGGWRCSLR